MNDPRYKSLAKLFDLVTPEKIFRQIKMNESEQTLQSILIDTRGTNIGFKNIEDKVKEIKDSEKVVEVYKTTLAIDQNKKYGWVSLKNSGDKRLPYLERSYRDSTALDLFFNGIPTFELTQLVPYLNVRFLISDDKQTETRRKHPSLQNFLDLYSTTANNKRSTDAMNKSQVTFVGNLYEGIITPGTGSYYATDMSIFNSPVLLNDRSKAKTDTSRPFLSIEKLDVSVDASKDFSVKYDIYTLSLVLHDRKNLELVADIFAPQLIGENKVYIEYGWSHPHDSAVNVYADYFNSRTRKKTICGIIATSYSFDDYGQVKITIKMQTLGSQHFFISNVSEQVYKNSLQEAMKHRQRINQLLRENFNIPKNTRAEKLLYGIAEGNVDQVSDESNKILLELMKSIEKNVQLKDSTTTPTNSAKKPSTNEKKAKPVKSIGELRKEYENWRLYTDDSESKKAASTNVSKLFNDFKKEYDIFKKNNPKLIAPLDDGDVKLSHLFDHFISKTLASKGFADEIQIMYYSFNEHASNMKNTSIGDFPLYIQNVETVFRNKCESTKLIDITIEDFITTISRNFLNDPKTPAFGFLKNNSNVYSNDPKINKAADEKSQKAINDLLNNKDIDFKTPNINFRVEFIPGSPSVYRIHVFDAVRTAGYDPALHYSSPLRSLSNTFKSKVEGTTEEDKRKIAEEYRKLTDQLNIPKSFSEIKDNLKFIYPKLSIGKQTSVVKSFQLSNNLDPLTTTGLMQNKIKQTQFKGIAGAPRSDGGNIPFLRVVPGNISMQTLGFPLADIHQSFFADFDTNTDLDNIYTVTKVTHTISPGVFTTNYELATSDSYAAYVNLSKEIDKVIDALNQGRAAIPDKGS